MQVIIINADNFIWTAELHSMLSFAHSKSKYKNSIDKFCEIGNYNLEYIPNSFFPIRDLEKGLNWSYITKTAAIFDLEQWTLHISVAQKT